MTAHVRVPGLVDVGIVDRGTQVFEIDGKQQVGREPRGAASLVGMMLTGRIRGRLRVGRTPLPTFVDRDAPGRNTLMEQAERRLSAVDLSAPWLGSDVAHLAYYVGGREILEPGIIAQEIVGRFFEPQFVATAESYDDARVIADWVKLPSPRAAWNQLTGKLDRARDRMWRLCRQDRVMIHGVVLALPNIVESLVLMRALFSKRPTADVDEMLRDCLKGPERLLRVVRAPLELMSGLAFHAGAVAIYDLKAVHEEQPETDLFMRGRWNQCPAHAIVPRLLGTIWKRAQHDARRPRALQFRQSERGSGHDAPPLTAMARNELTPGNLETLKQWELDQLYARLEAGEMPRGSLEGRFFFPEGSGLKSFAQAAPALARAAGVKLDLVARLGELFWKGKTFFPDQGVVRNILEHGEALALLFGVHPAALRRADIGGRKVPLMFPARLFRGESLADSRRESIIIDYDDGPNIDGYVPGVDFIASRKGLRIRDEIRQIRPGLYLGRAYVDQRLLLTFTLHSAALEGKATQSARARGDNGGSDGHGTGPYPMSAE